MLTYDKAACLFGWKENRDGKIIFRVGSFIFQVRKIISSLAQHYTFSPKVEGKKQKEWSWCTDLGTIIIQLILYYKFQNLDMQ